MTKIEINVNGEVDAILFAEKFISILNEIVTPVSDPAPIPVKTRWPQGKGMLIWKLPRVANGDMRLLAQQAKEAGFSWVSIKVVEYNTLYIHNAPLIASAVNELRKVGISVRGWGYTYPNNSKSQAQKTVEVVKDLELDGFEIDAEGEYKVPDAKLRASEYVGELRNGLPDTGIGFCSFRYPDLHTQMPWQEFLSICDYHAPQVYWVGTTLPNSPEHQIKKSYEQLKKLKDIPYIPIGIACGHPYLSDMWYPSIPQLDNFATYSNLSGFPGYGYYEWAPAFERKDWWNTISQQK